MTNRTPKPSKLYSRENMSAIETLRLLGAGATVRLDSAEVESLGTDDAERELRLREMTRAGMLKMRSRWVGETFAGYEWEVAEF